MHRNKVIKKYARHSKLYYLHFKRSTSGWIFLQGFNTIGIYSNISKALHLLVTFTETTLLTNFPPPPPLIFQLKPWQHLIERSFSKLNTVKSKIRTTLTQTRFDCLMLLLLLNNRKQTQLTLVRLWWSSKLEKI